MFPDMHPGLTHVFCSPIFDEQFDPFDQYFSETMRNLRIPEESLPPQLWYACSKYITLGTYQLWMDSCQGPISHILLKILHQLSNDLVV